MKQPRNTFAAENKRYEHKGISADNRSSVAVFRLLTIAVLLQSSVLMAGPIIKGKVVDASTGE